MSAGVLCRSEIWKRNVSISRNPRFLTREEAHHSLASGYVLRWSINNNLHRVILEAIDDRSAATLLHDVMYGNLSTTLAAEEVVWAATAKSSDVYLESLSLQIVFLPLDIRSYSSKLWISSKEFSDSWKFLSMRKHES